MLNRSQIQLLIMMRNRGDSIFSGLPLDVIDYLIKNSLTAYDPESDIVNLLGYIVANKPDLVQKLLDANPELVLEANHVKLDNMIRCVTPYECALGAGNEKIAEIIKPYFAQIKDGEKEEARQYARYKNHIDMMLTQEPDYTLNELLDMILASTDDDVAKVLDIGFESPIHDVNKMFVDSGFDKEELAKAFNIIYMIQREQEQGLPLLKAVREFNNVLAPRDIIAGMHINFQNYQHALDLRVSASEKLKQASPVKRKLFDNLVQAIAQTLSKEDRESWKDVYQYLDGQNNGNNNADAGYFRTHMIAKQSKLAELENPKKSNSYWCGIL